MGPAMERKGARLPGAGRRDPQSGKGSRYETGLIVAKDRHAILYAF